MLSIEQHLANFPRTRLMIGETPIEPLNRLSELLGIELWLKRDDLTGLSFGGNKTRQLEFYFGEAVSQGADTVLITGAVQSNYVRAAAAAAARLGFKAILQLEERVAGMGPSYYRSGNVLLAQILGAEHISYPLGEDESGADNALEHYADKLRAQGRKPYVIHLGINHIPLGAIGYLTCGDEINRQLKDIDAVVVPTGSGSTHAGLLTGLRLSGNTCDVFGICVRRNQGQQTERMKTVLTKLADVLNINAKPLVDAINIRDGALAPGYGLVSDGTREAIALMARHEGIFLDPVYTAKTFAGLLGLLKQGHIQTGQKIVMLHTGGLPALFAYQDEIQTA